MSGTRMTKGDRDELLKLIRAREKVLKTAAVKRSADMLAEFERQISKQYNFDSDEIWKSATTCAIEAIRKAQEQIAERARELGIPEEFAPRLMAGSIWLERGQNAVKERRDELRWLAKAEIASVERTACAEIERMSVDAQTQLLTQGLDSPAAQAFIAALPTIEKLMPGLSVTAIESRVAAPRSSRMLQ